MAAEKPFFWDTHGFFALLSSDDKSHKRVVEVMKELAEARAPGITTDWVVGETCTLLSARKKSHLISRFLSSTSHSRALRIERIGEQRFEAAKSLLLKRQDRGYSFTDCTSFVVMKELGLSKAMTDDEHFKREGLDAMLSFI